MSALAILRGFGVKKLENGIKKVLYKDSEKSYFDRLLLSKTGLNA